MSEQATHSEPGPGSQSPAASQPAAASQPPAASQSAPESQQTTDTYRLLGAFVDELARCGVRDACTSPGSRCTPLILTLARDPRVRCYSHIDERCAGFFAVGLAKAAGLPVAVTCTSGTAVAELLPAAVEAHEARVPLLILSADRPPELRERGAGQAIDQIKLFGGFAKWFFEVGNHRATPERLRWMRTLACRAFWTSMEGRPGVVHLNFPLREPLVCEELPPPSEGGRGGGAPFVIRTAGRRDAEADARALWEMIGNARFKTGARRGSGTPRGVVVAGRHERSTPLAQAAVAFCEAAGWPLLADPMSRARRGDTAIAHYDLLLREPAFMAGHVPEVVVRVGDLPVSKPLREWLAGLEGVPQIALDPEGAWQDPAGVVSHSLRCKPAATLQELARLVAPQEPSIAAREPSLAAPRESSPETPQGPNPETPQDPSTEALREPAGAVPQTKNEDWLSSWRSADARAAEAILGALRDDGLSEPCVAAELGVLLPSASTLFVASSMPVRDIETFWPVREDDPPRVLCNRGANGIDGTVSSAFGAAAANGEPVVLLIGDVALAHDIGGLLSARRLSLKLTIVLLNNEGGGIFDFLPVSASQAAQEDGVYTEHIATPTHLDFSRAAALYGLAHERVDSIAGLRAALEHALAAPRSTMIEVRTERTANVKLHRDVSAAVGAALAR